MTTERLWPNAFSNVVNGMSTRLSRLFPRMSPFSSSTPTTVNRCPPIRMSLPDRVAQVEELLPDVRADDGRAAVALRRRGR